MPRSAPRTKIAALGTLAALGALAAVATASNPARRPHAPAPAPVAAVRTAPPKPIVVHRTVGVLTKFAPARVSGSAAPSHASAPATHRAAVATPAAAAPAPTKAAAKPKAQPTTSDSEAADLPEPGVTEDECLPVTVGGAPESTTTAGAPATVAFASASTADRRAVRRAARRARRRAERRARRRAHRRAQRRVVKTVRGGRPLRTSHPLPEDAPGGVVDGCGLVPVPAAGDAASTPAAPASAGSTVNVP